jgi:integrase
MSRRFITLKNYKGIRKDTKTGKYQARKYIDGQEYSSVFEKISDATQWKNSFHPDLAEGSSSLRLFGKQKPNGVEDHFFVEDIWKLYQEQHLPSVSRMSRIDIIKRANNILPDLFGYRMVEINANLLDKIMKTKVSDVKYINQLRRHSFDKELKTLKAICNWYRENHDAFFVVPILKRHFIAGALNKPVVKKSKKMSPEQVRSFFESFDDEFWKDFAQLHFFMAGRVQEPGGLQTRSIDFKNKVLVVDDVAVYGHNKRFFYLKEEPKNGEERLVHLNRTMISILKRRVSDSRLKPCSFFRESSGEKLDFVFQIDGQPLNYRQIQYRYNKALKKAKLWPTYKATHILRKAMANIVRQNMGLEAAQAVGGWKTREIVERVYTDEAPSELSRSAICLVEELIS